jgi:endonuclease/exonuclease/phosphatase family metal-dependent hydrolase
MPKLGLPNTLVLCGLLLTSCEWIADGQNFTREQVPVFKAKAAHSTPPAAPQKLKVLAWNVKYGACRIDFWFDFWGDRVQMSQPEVEDCLTKVAGLIREYDPDIVMAEEIEVGSKRSAYIDMVRFLLERTELTYAAYFETWDARYVPSEGVGRINLGNAIFSKYPITKAERIRQVDRTDQDALTKTFYIKRALGRVELDIGRTVVAYVIHSEAYDQDGTKQKQIVQAFDLAKEETLPFVMGGDFNELPPVCDERAAAGSADSCEGKLKLSGFLDEPKRSIGTMFEQPPYTPSVMKRFYDTFNPSISLSRYGVGEAAQRPYFTHTVLGPDIKNEDGVPGFWNRTLDYLFIRKTDTWSDTDVLQEAGRMGIQSDALRLSDHAPVVGTWQVGP